MPPKAKFTKEEIVNAALDIVRENGPDALTARTLGARLGSSSCPIFTVFANMSQVHEEVVEAAKVIYKQYVEKGLSLKPAFGNVGKQYILFATNESKLFNLLFMSERDSVPGISDILPLIDESYEKILSSITDEYGVDDCTAKKLYRHLWIYTHGIATLCATKMCRFTAEELNEMMKEVFTSLLKTL